MQSLQVPWLSNKHTRECRLCLILCGPRISGSRLLHAMSRKQNSTSCQPGKRSTSKVQSTLSTKCVLILHYHRVKTLHIESSRGWDGLSSLLVPSLKQFDLSKFLQLTAYIPVALIFITTFLKNIYQNKSRTMQYLILYMKQPDAQKLRQPYRHWEKRGSLWDHSGFCVITECKRLSSPSSFPPSLLPSGSVSPLCWALHAFTHQHTGSVLQTEMLPNQVSLKGACLLNYQLHFYTVRNFFKFIKFPLKTLPLQMKH